MKNRGFMGYILDFKRIKKKHYFCEHIIAASIAEYYHRDSKFGFIRSMNVNVNEKKADIGDKLEYDTGYFLKDLRYFHGIDFGPFCTGGYDLFVKLEGPLEYDQEFPEAVFCVYFKNTGALLFMGKDDKYHFVDIHAGKGQITVDLQELRENMVAFRKITIRKEEFCSHMNLEEVKEAFVKSLQTDGFWKKNLEAIRRYKDLLEGCEDFSTLYREYEETKFSDSLTRIFAGRNNFYDLVQMLSERYPAEDFGGIAEKIRRDYYEWNIVWSLFYKGVLTRNLEKQKPRILYRFERIYDLEKEIFEGLMGHQVQDVGDESENEKLVWAENARQINLKTYFNNRAFLKQGEEYQSGLWPREGYDEFFYYEEPVKVPLVGDFYYQNPKDWDNICCCGQRIAVSEARYRQIAVAGCCFPGGYEETLRLKWKDGSVSEVEIGISDIHTTLPTQGDRILYSGPVGVFSERRQSLKTGFNGHIFLFETTIPSEKELAEIQLPDFKFMHIFAIILE